MNPSFANNAKAIGGVILIKTILDTSCLMLDKKTE